MSIPDEISELRAAMKEMAKAQTDLANQLTIFMGTQSEKCSRHGETVNALKLCVFGDESEGTPGLKSTVRDTVREQMLTRWAAGIIVGGLLAFGTARLCSVMFPEHHQSSTTSTVSGP